MLFAALVPLPPAEVLVTLGLANAGAMTSSGYVSPSVVEEVLGGEDDFHAVTPDAIAFFVATMGWPSFLVVDSPDAATLFLGGKDDFYAVMLHAIAFFAAAMGWPSFFVVDSRDAATPVFAAFSGGLLCFAVLSGVPRWLVDGSARAFAAIFWNGCRGVALSGLGDRRLLGCLQSFPGGFAAAN